MKQLSQVPNALLASYTAIPTSAAAILTYSIASAAQFLAGSTSKRIPYEIAHGLRLALDEWAKSASIITIAISPDLYRGFYFMGVHPSFYKLADAFLGIKVDAELVQISLPEIYRRRPLYCTPLYHELGHYLDVHLGISRHTLLTDGTGWPLPDIVANGIDKKRLEQIHESHRMEYFADLFGASYGGAAYVDFLDEFAGGEGVSDSHPATPTRISVINDFLEGKPNDVINLFQKTLDALGYPSLGPRFTKIDVTKAFNNVRPYQIKSDAEVHGILDSGWLFLKEVLSKPEGPWKEMQAHQAEKTINDLIEKSIRNYMISKSWNQ